jgi:hypothetical protein
VDLAGKLNWSSRFFIRISSRARLEVAELCCGGSVRVVRSSPSPNVVSSEATQRVGYAIHNPL